jgi:polyhydroxyalkanoate synthase
MTKINLDTIIRNFQQVCEQYNELMLHLIKAEGLGIPNSLVNHERNTEIFIQICERFFRDPKKFLDLQVCYNERFIKLVSNTLYRFAGIEADPIFKPHMKDKRFRDEAWQENIFFDFIKQYYLMADMYLEESVDCYNLDQESSKYLRFVFKQVINAMSPSNSVLWNPQVLRETVDTGWKNIVEGMKKLLSDLKSAGGIFAIPTTDNSAFALGKNIASSPGKVVYQNDLIQLICYEPKEKTHALPLLIIPPFINKYYILDLSSHNSLVKFLVEKNFQLFMVSWRNPDASLADKNFEDYMAEGVIDPCKYIIQDLGYQKLNAVGYCVGGTLLATAASYLKAEGVDYINGLSFFTTLLDFTDPGEMSIFINRLSISAIEKEMESKGYFDGRYLSNSFSLLRANDLIWSFFVNNYLLGKSPVAFDLLFWNNDPSNLAPSMHSYYLRNMYLDNLLAAPGALKMFETPIDLGKIDCDSFWLAGSEDHIVPWQGAYKSMNLLQGNKKFILSTSGHVAGVINPPSDNKYGYKVLSHEDRQVSDINSPEEWLSKTQEFKGSWWSDWLEWLVERSGDLNNSERYYEFKTIELAPGSYVKNLA